MFKTLTEQIMARILFTNKEEYMIVQNMLHTINETRTANKWYLSTLKTINHFLN